MGFSGEVGKIGLLGHGQRAVSPSGCPTTSQQIEQVDFLPQRAAQEREEAGEAVAPRGQEGLVAQQQIAQGSAPDLPAHGVGAVTQEVGELEGLFDLLEEGFDRPTAKVAEFRG